MNLRSSAQAELSDDAASMVNFFQGSRFGYRPEDMKRRTYDSVLIILLCFTVVTWQASNDNPTV
jgi:hypothetical protein